MTTPGLPTRRVLALLGELPQGAFVLDVGCAGFRVHHGAASINRGDLRQFGVDYGAPDGESPPGFDLLIADLSREPIPHPDDKFDLVVASHVIEHIATPLEFFAELIRVLKPGGRLYIEAPSERSLWLPGMFMQHDRAYSISFFDDPTHLSRPWSAQALHRLARCYACDPLQVGYDTGLVPRLKGLILFIGGLIAWRGSLVEQGLWKLIGWASFAVVAKPKSLRGKPSFRYYLPGR